MPLLRLPAIAATVALTAVCSCTRDAPAPGTRPAAPSSPASAPATAPAPAAAVSSPPQHFGAPLRGAAPGTLASVVERPDDYAGRQVTVDGRVRASCTRKGCWMELASAMDDAAPGCRVTFKDYAFFVPLDARGSAARVEGQVMVRTIPATEVAHLESEGGHFPRKLADGSAREVRIVADGVDLWRID